MKLIGAAFLAVGVAIMAGAFSLKAALNITATLDQIERLESAAKPEF